MTAASKVRPLTGWTVGVVDADAVADVVAGRPVRRDAFSLWASTEKRTRAGAERACEVLAKRARQRFGCDPATLRGVMISVGQEQRTVEVVSV